MARSMGRDAAIEAPFLRSIELPPERIVAGEFPYTPPIFSRPRPQIDLTQPITFSVGESDTGESILLEAIAVRSNFSSSGCARSSHCYCWQRHVTLGIALELKTGSRQWHLLFRAKGFSDLASYLDQAGSRCDGDRGLCAMSHGEAFPALFELPPRRCGRGRVVR